MKKIIIKLCVFVTMSTCVCAQSVGINNDGSVPHASAILDVKSTAKGVLVPRMTAAERSAIANPATGLLVFQTEPVPAFCYYNGLNWINLGNGSPVGNEGYSSNYGLVTTFAGSGNYSVSDGVGTAANIQAPVGLASDKKGTLYLTETSQNSIRKITSAGVVTTFAGSITNPGYVNATGTAARFFRPQGMTVDGAGNIYVAEINHLIRRITPGGVVTTIAGSPSNFIGFDGDSTLAGFSNPYGITRDASGNLYVTDIQDHTIRKIDPDKKVTTIAGVPTVMGLVNSSDNTGYTLFNRPTGIAVDPSGNLYIADQRNHVIRKIDPSGVVTTFAGTGVPGAADGTLATASFNQPIAIAIDPTGNLYIADQFNHSIRKISTTGIVSTIAGSGVPGNLDGPGNTALFSSPTSLTLDQDGNLFVGDSNGTIRKIFLH